MKRRVEGRNVEDSDADLYAEYHGTDCSMNNDNDLDLSSYQDNSPVVRHRVTFSIQQSESKDSRNPYEYHPDLTNTIETDFRSMYQKKKDNTKVSQGQRSEDTNTSETEKDCENDTQNNDSINGSAGKGYDFESKFDELYREQRHIVEDSRIREERRQYQERVLEHMVNRSKSWSEGNGCLS